MYSQLMLNVNLMTLRSDFCNILLIINWESQLRKNKMLSVYVNFCLPLFFFTHFSLSVTYASSKRPRSNLTRWARRRRRRWSRTPRLRATSSTRWRRPPTSSPPRASVSDTSSSTTSCRLISFKMLNLVLPELPYFITNWSLASPSTLKPIKSLSKKYALSL